MGDLMQGNKSLFYTFLTPRPDSEQREEAAASLHLAKLTNKTCIINLSIVP